MNTLAIDCATEACSVALFAHDRLIDGDCRMLGRGHAEALVPMIAALPGQGKADRIAVSMGPGSFTGLRVGLAAARALALAWKAELVGFATHDLIAAMARAETGAQPVTVAMTGGHGEWFVAEYDASGKVLMPACSLAPPVASDRGRADCVAGSQAQALVEARGWGTACAIWPDARRFGLIGEPALVRNVLPIYARAPDARLPGAG